jgi:monovalent cation:proton antiporter-2 (CPA2) family protein
METESFLFQSFIYLAAAVISVPIAKRLGFGSVLGYLIAGVIIGPYGLEFIGEEGQDVMHFAEFGVVMMLFLIGLELQPALLWKLKTPILGYGGLQVVITSLMIAVVSLLFGLSWNVALAVGMTLALSSTALVLQTLNERGLMKTDAGQSSFSVLLFQDIAVIPMLAVMPLLALSGSTPQAAASHGAGWLEHVPRWGQTLLVVVAVLLIILIGRYLMRPVFRYVAGARLREVFTATALLLVIGTALLMLAVGLSPALGTFLAGVVLANSEYRHELESNIEPFKGLLLGIFFIAVGAAIDFELILAQPGVVAALVAGLFFIKFIVLLVLGRLFKMGFDQILIFAFALAEGGEFAFVLFSFATQSGVMETGLANLLVAVVALSMPIAPVLLLINEKLIQPRFGTKESVDVTPDEIEETHPVIIAGFGRVGSIIGRFLRANGVAATVLDNDSDEVELLRKLGIKVYYGDVCRCDLLESAGAREARMIIIVIDDHEVIIELVHTVQKHFPNLTIMARARGRSEAYELLDAGVDHVFRETFDTSLRVGIEALKLLGFGSHHAHRMSRTLRKHDEQSVKDLARMRHDRKTYISAAKQRIQDLEELMLSELHRPEERDAGWDTESLRKDFGGQ